jgi:hypothetical protein
MSGKVKDTSGVVDVTQGGAVLVDEGVGDSDPRITRGLGLLRKEGREWAIKTGELGLEVDF